MVRDTEELEKVEQLRHRLQDIMKPDMLNDSSLFLRFLRARNFDINAAENMLRKHINWRTTYRIDTILSWYIPHEVVENYLPVRPVCFDKEGYPIMYAAFGNLDIRGIVSSAKKSEIFNFVIRRLEMDIRTMEAQSEKFKKKIDKWTYILDFDNLSFSTVTHKLSVERAIQVFSMYESNYPELLKSALLINTTWIFQFAFPIIKSLLSGPTLQKIKVFGTEGWKEELLRQVDADELPVFLGGNKTTSDEDPLYSKLINPAAVPKSYYMINQKANFFASSDVKRIFVNRLSKERIRVDVLHPDSIIEWEFQTKENDIVFSFLRKDGAEVKEIISRQRCDPSLCSEIGYFKCKDAGIYFLEFDNTYSWLHQKEIYYKYNIIKNNEDTIEKDNGL